MTRPRILSTWSIRKKLLLLLLFIFLPAFALIAAVGLEHRGYDIEDVKQDALMMVQSLAAQQDQIAVGMEQVLSTLAQLPELHGLDPEACNQLFRKVHNRHPYYSQISAVKPDGEMFASSTPFEPGSIKLADRKHIKDVVRTAKFSVGEYVFGRQSKAASLNYAYPVLDPDNNLVAIVTAGFRLDQYVRLLDKVHLPEDSIVTVLDHRGVRLCRLPENDRDAVGKSIPDDAFRKISGSREQGIFEKVSEDGKTRIYAFKQLRLTENSPPNLYVVFGINKSVLIHSANMKMLRNLSILGVASVLGMVALWVFVNLAFVKPVEQLVGVTRRFGMGELSTRAGLPHKADELGQLAMSLDNMASLLEISVAKRTAELAGANDALRSEIIERGKTEKALRAAMAKAEDAQSKTESIIAALGDSLIIQDTRHKILYQNAISKKTLGDHEGEYCYAAIHQRDKICDGCPMEMSFADGLIHKQENIATPPGRAQRHVEITASPLRDAEGRITAGIELSRDISELKQRQEELSRAKEAAESASAAKSQFLANMSHEIRTPMNGIIGMIKLALRNNPDSRQRECLSMAESSAASLLRLLNDIMDFSKIEARKMDLLSIAFSLEESIGEAMSIVAVQARNKGLKLSRRISPEIPAVLIGDSGRLCQILINLLGNAVKFTEQGEVILLVEVQSADGKEIILHFSVSDTGIGIPEDKNSIIFDAFTQADSSTTRNFGGTGLGLAISSRLVELMDGTIRVESEPGNGSTFHFTARFGLSSQPEASVHDGEKDRRRVSAYSLSAAPPRLLRILLAEDNPINRKLTVSLLEERGHTVTVANNGGEAISLFDAKPFDLILMDIQMPEVDGFQATSAIRAREEGQNTHIPIIAMTAHALKGDQQRCLDAGMDNYITKPVDPDGLIGMVEECAPGENAPSGPAKPPQRPIQAASSRERESHGEKPMAEETQRQETPALNVPVFDMSVALAHVRGKMDLLREIAALFEQQCPELLAQIRESIAGGDCKRLQQSAHTLKNSVGNFGGMDAFRAASKMEELGYEGDIRGAEAFMEETEQEIMMLRNALSALNGHAEQ